MGKEDRRDSSSIYQERVNDLEGRISPLVDVLSDYVLLYGEKHGILHSLPLTFDDGRSARMTLVNVSGLESIEQIKAHPNPNDTLELAIDSDKVGVVGVNTAERISDHSLIDYRVYTSPDTWFDLISPLRSANDGLQVQILEDYEESLRLFTNAIKKYPNNIRRFPPVKKNV